jgi:acetyltransferase-like isoleucine patch superfamily enzyme
MIQELILAELSTWANEHQSVRGVWRLRQWIIRQQLRTVQQVGRGVEVFGPIRLQNLGQIEIGQYVELRSSWHRPISITVLRPGARLLIGEHAFINWGVNIGVVEEVSVGAHSLIADDCIIYDTDWHSSDGSRSEISGMPTRIGRGVWLGARVIVLKGVTIGDNTVVAANSTVTQDLPSNVLAAGSPARVIKDIARHGQTV